MPDFKDELTRISEAARILKEENIEIGRKAAEKDHAVWIREMKKAIENGKTGVTIENVSYPLRNGDINIWANHGYERRIRELMGPDFICTFDDSYSCFCHYG